MKVRKSGFYFISFCFFLIFTSHSGKRGSSFSALSVCSSSDCQDFGKNDFYRVVYIIVHHFFL